MPKDDERKEMTQEELDAREEKFRTFFTTSVAQVPEEMTRRDDENEEKPKSLLGRLFRREKGEQQEGGTPEESRTGEIQLGGEEPEEPSDLELVLALEEEVAGPKPEQPKPAEPVSAPQPEPEKPQKPAGPIKAPEPPAPKPEKKPAEKQAAEAAPAEQEKTGAPQAKPETETAAAAAGAAAELAAMSPADFMERIRELTQGVPGARDLLARVLKANGWSSFRTLERSDYATAVNAIAAELAGGRA